MFDSSPGDYTLAGIMSELPEEYSLDYMIYGISVSASDEEKLWRMPYIDVIKRSMFKKFDNYAENKFREYKKKKDANRRT